MHDDDFELPSVPAAELLRAIDLEQDQLLRQLDDLNDRLETILRQCTPPKPEIEPAIPQTLKAA